MFRQSWTNSKIQLSFHNFQGEKFYIAWYKCHFVVCRVQGYIYFYIIHVCQDIIYLCPVADIKVRKCLRNNVMFYTPHRYEISPSKTKTYKYRVFPHNFWHLLHFENILFIIQSVYCNAIMFLFIDVHLVLL